jgi:osmoprotectant transport system permease protein
MNLISEIFKYVALNSDKLSQALFEHCLLSLSALFIGIVLSIPLSIFCSKDNKFLENFVNLLTSLRVIPSIAILALAMPFIGTGFKPSLFALTIIACPPILINATLGLKAVNKTVIEAATGMGMNKLQILLKIKLPLAFPLIYAGIKLATVSVVSSATLAAFIGGGGLGIFIINGLSMYDFPLLIVGAISVALLAILSESALTLIENIFINYKKV